MDKIPVTVGGKKYYKDGFNTETLVKFDKYDVGQLGSITMMKHRCNAQYGGVTEAGVYMMTIPKDMMDEDRYYSIPEQYYDLFVKYKVRI